MSLLFRHVALAALLAFSVLPLVGLAEASGPAPQCMYYYYELDLGAVRYVQRDSCHAELYVLGERVLPLA